MTENVIRVEFTADDPDDKIKSVTRGNLCLERAYAEDLQDFGLDPPPKDDFWIWVENLPEGDHGAWVLCSQLVRMITVLQTGIKILEEAE